MTYDEFKKEVMEDIKSYLPESYQDFDMELQTIRKAGITYDGLIIKKCVEGASISPVLNLTDAYNEYKDGEPFEKVLERLVKIRTNNTPGFNFSDIMKLNKVKDKIMPKLINYEDNKDYLTGKPFTRMEDLAIVYAVRFAMGDWFGDAVITDELASAWGINYAELHKMAIKNLEDSPFVFTSLLSALMGSKDTEVIEDIDIKDNDMPYFILSNEHKTKGAIMAINPAVMNRIVAHLGDVYVIPSSVDEVIIIPKTFSDDIERLVTMVTRINESEVAPEDRLSNNIYEWDKNEKALKIVN